MHQGNPAAAQGLNHVGCGQRPARAAASPSRQVLAWHLLCINSSMRRCKSRPQCWLALGWLRYPWSWQLGHMDAGLARMAYQQALQQ
jgi:hypothetical protein